MGGQLTAATLRRWHSWDSISLNEEAPLEGLGELFNRGSYGRPESYYQSFERVWITQWWATILPSSKGSAAVEISCPKCEHTTPIDLDHYDEGLFGCEQCGLIVNDAVVAQRRWDQLRIRVAPLIHYGWVELVLPTGEATTTPLATLCTGPERLAVALQNSRGNFNASGLRVDVRLLLELHRKLPLRITIHLMGWRW